MVVTVSALRKVKLSLQEVRRDGYRLGHWRPVMQSYQDGSERLSRPRPRLDC